MGEIEQNIYGSKTVADVILQSNIAKWKKWVLKKILPAELWISPAQKLAKLDKGAVIGSIKISTIDISDDNADLSVEYSKEENG